MSSVEAFQLVDRFEGLRSRLLSGPYAVHRQKPLAYWVLPADRRLPLAFLGRTLASLLSSPFKELAATPGIGLKKMGSLVTLLARAADTPASDLETTLPRLAEPEKPRAEAAAANGFDPAAVSEVVWAQWRLSVVRHGLGHEPLGRFAPSLRNLARVIWNAPLGTYTSMTLAEVRSLRTHGEKRVRAVLEVFYSVHLLVAGMGSQEHLAIRIVPRRIDAVETWVGRQLQAPGIPSEQDLFDRFVSPLLEQIGIDTTEQVAALAQKRVGIHGPPISVRQVARTMGLTRARVYQLLNEINDVMSVRWPLGRHQVYELSAKFEAELAGLEHPPSLAQFKAATELFYPYSRRGAAGPLDRATARAGFHAEAGVDDDGPVVVQDA
jgi:hypothetical protein